MPRHVAFQADVRRRISQILLAIVPDAPFPTRLINDIISLDSMLGGPFEHLEGNLRIGTPTAKARIAQIGTTEDLRYDNDRGTITITPAGQARMAAEFARLRLTPQARERQKHGLDTIALDLLMGIHEFASFLPGASTDDTLTPDEFALTVPHFLHLSRHRLRTTTGDWDLAQNLATLWLLHDHGVMPEQVLYEHTHELLPVCATSYQHWDWEAMIMLVEAVEQMLKADWDEAVSVGSQFLAMAEYIIPHLDDADQQTKYRNDAQHLRQQIDLRATSH